MTDNELIDDFYASHGGKPTMKEDIWFYESSWDMLIPVWYKFRDIKFRDEFVKTLHINYCARISNKLAWEDITSCYKQLVIVIKWYNDLTILQKGSQ